MASWIRCRCGELVYTNLFSGADVYSLILDSDYDAVQRPADDDAFSRLFLSGREVFRCKVCRRLIVYWDKGEQGAATFYSEEQCKNDEPDNTQQDAGPNDEERG